MFFVAPTIFGGDDSTFNLNLSDDGLLDKFIGSINMEKGIYSENSNFFAPLYRQVGLNCFVARGYNQKSSDPIINEAFLIAYNDIESAFEYFVSVSDRPFVLAGFSQGAEMIIKLIKNKLSDSSLQKSSFGATLRESDEALLNTL